MMTADINREQLILLAQCVLFGAGAGLCYDVFRAARRVLCPGRAGETACDALFCVLMLAAAFRFAIVNAAGQWRLFVLLGACAGGALWQGCLSAAALPLFLGAAAALRAAAHRAGRGIQWCFQWASAEKIREIRKMFTDAGKDIEIMVDGQVKETTAPKLVEAGANVLVLGTSGLFNSYKPEEYPKAVQFYQNL